MKFPFSKSKNYNKARTKLQTTQWKWTSSPNWWWRWAALKITTTRQDIVYLMFFCWHRLSTSRGEHLTWDLSVCSLNSTVHHRAASLQGPLECSNSGPAAPGGRGWISELRPPLDSEALKPHWPKVCSEKTPVRINMWDCETDSRIINRWSAASIIALQYRGHVKFSCNKVTKWSFTHKCVNTPCCDWHCCSDLLLQLHMMFSWVSSHSSLELHWLIVLTETETELTSPSCRSSQLE